MSRTAGRIDVHHHAIPAVYQAALDETGLFRKAGVDPIYWNVEEDLAVMDRNGIDAAILSISAPGTVFVEPSTAPGLARATNEALARLISDQPRKFGAFAVIPLPDVDAAIREIDYALDTLKLDGIGLMSNFSGIYLGDERFAPVLRHLDDREAVVFVHPTIVAMPPEQTLGLPPSLFEFPFDTTRTVASLLFSGALERHTRFKMILSHAGGTLPFLAKRMTYASTILSSVADREPVDLLGSLRRLYYDTAMSSNRYTLSALTALIDTDHVLFGTDYPYVPEKVTQETVEGVMAYFSDEDRMKVERSNFAPLFPQLMMRIS